MDDTHLRFHCDPRRRLWRANRPRHLCGSSRDRSCPCTQRSSVLWRVCLSSIDPTARESTANDHKRASSLTTIARYQSSKSYLDIPTRKVRRHTSSLPVRGDGSVHRLTRSLHEQIRGLLRERSIGAAVVSHRWHYSAAVSGRERVEQSARPCGNSLQCIKMPVNAAMKERIFLKRAARRGNEQQH